MSRFALTLLAIAVFAIPVRAETMHPSVVRVAADIQAAITRAQTYANTPESGVPLSRYYISSAAQRSDPPGWDVMWKKNLTGNDDPAGKSLASQIILHLNDDGTSRCDGCIGMEPPR